MRFPRRRGATSQMIRVFILDNSKTNGAGLTGLTSASTNLTIAYIRELDSAGTTYTGANIQTITTIGTFQQPTDSSHIRFKAVDATAFPGLYEIHFHDSATAFGTGDTSQTIAINIYEATTTALNIGPNMVNITLVPWDPQDGVRLGLTSLPNAVANATGGLATLIRGGTAQAGAASTITLDAGASTTDNLYQDALVFLTGGTGAGQVRSIQSYVGSTKVATVFPNWATNPDATSTFTLIPMGQVDVGNWLNVSATGMPMPTYTQPTGFLAATFPSGTIANTTNITAGVITTVTNLTNLPSIPANWLTAAGINAGALNGKGDWFLAANAPVNFPALLISVGGHISNVDTLTTYTGNTLQTGDSYARLGAPAGASVSADIAEIEAETDGIAAIPTNPLLTSDARLNHLDADITSRASATAAPTWWVVPDNTDIATLITQVGVLFNTRIPGVVQPQTGDSYARLGAPTGASIAADLAEIEGETDALVAGVIVSTNNDKTGYALTVAEENAIADAIRARQTTQGYAVNGVAPTVEQFLYMIWGRLAEVSIAGTVLTVNKIDHTTPAMTLTLGDATNPVTVTRAT